MGRLEPPGSHAGGCRRRALGKCFFSPDNALHFVKILPTRTPSTDATAMAQLPSLIQGSSKSSSQNKSLSFLSNLCQGLVIMRNAEFTTPTSTHPGPPGFLAFFYFLHCICLYLELFNVIVCVWVATGYYHICSKWRNQLDQDSTDVMLGQESELSSNLNIFYGKNNCLETSDMMSAIGFKIILVRRTCT